MQNAPSWLPQALILAALLVFVLWVISEIFKFVKENKTTIVVLAIAAVGTAILLWPKVAPSQPAQAQVQAAPPSGKLLCPTPGFNITQPFGKDGIPGEPNYRGQPHFHEGVDLAVHGYPELTAGVPIHAAEAGVVKFAALDPVSSPNINIGQGNQVVVWSGYRTTLYDHLSRFAVRQGDQVVRGQVLGYVGSTGFSSSYHLHFGVSNNANWGLYDGDWVDPAPLMESC